jgi:hypothetical protein
MISSRHRIGEDFPLCRFHVGESSNRILLPATNQSPRGAKKSGRGLPQSKGFARFDARTMTRQRFGVRKTRTTDRDLRLRAAPPAAFTTENPAIESSFRLRIGFWADEATDANPKIESSHRSKSGSRERRSKSARGLAHSKGFARFDARTTTRQRFGVRQPSVAFASAQPRGSAASKAVSRSACHRSPKASPGSMRLRSRRMQPTARWSA